MESTNTHGSNSKTITKHAGKDGTVMDTRMAETLKKRLDEVQAVFDHNTGLIREISRNQQDGSVHVGYVDGGLAKNVSLLRELNNNMEHVVQLYTDISTNYVKSMAADGSHSGSAKLDRVLTPSISHDHCNAQ